MIPFVAFGHLRRYLLFRCLEKIELITLLRLYLLVHITLPLLCLWCMGARFCSASSFTSKRSLHLTAVTAVAYHHIKFCQRGDNSGNKYRLYLGLESEARAHKNLCTRLARDLREAKPAWHLLVIAISQLGEFVATLSAIHTTNEMMATDQRPTHVVVGNCHRHGGEQNRGARR